jgi:hypothetical protein
VPANLKPGGGDILHWGPLTAQRDDSTYAVSKKRQSHRYQLMVIGLAFIYEDGK